MLQDAGVRFRIPGTGLRKDRMEALTKAYDMARETHTPVSPRLHDLHAALVRLDHLEKHLLSLGGQIEPKVVWEVGLFQSGTTIVTPASSVVYDVHFHIGHARYMQGDDAELERHRHSVARSLAALEFLCSGLPHVVEVATMKCSNDALQVQLRILLCLRTADEEAGADDVEHRLLVSADVFMQHPDHDKI